MEILNQIIDAAKKSPAQIALAEADDPRVLQAAVRAQQAGVAAVTLVGESEKIQATAHSLALNIDELTIEDVHHSEHRAALVDALVQRRKHRGMTRSEEHTSELQSRGHLVCRLLLDKK